MPFADSAAPPRINDYDSFAEAHSAENGVNLFNAYYERPATLALAGDVVGRRIFDAGCGSGPVFAALRDRGAIVTGFDSSAEMLKLARQRLGDDADLQLAELRRVLKRGGRLIMSVNHPITGHPLARPGADYWATYQWSDEYTTSSGQSYVLTYWQRPLPAMIED